jgi:cytochrome d ubiquinol oxidase subunit II
MLNILWFGLIGVLMFGYAALDGFDLGVGTLLPFAKGDKERRLLLNSIGPIWDGNEVWLVVFGGALFAVFPNAYATIFSGFYTPFMLLLVALIFRAVSIEVRSKREEPVWRSFFDIAFCLSSAFVGFLMGVAVGNVLQGVPIGSDGEYQGADHFFALLTPYPLMVGFLAVTIFALHGAIYLYWKTEGELQSRVRQWMWTTFGAFLALYLLTTTYTLIMLPQVVVNFRTVPLAWIVPALNILAVANIPRAIYFDKPAYAFLSSCATLAAFVFLLGMALFPNLLPSRLDPHFSLTIYNAASSLQTLRTATLIAIIGMPLVATYSIIVYWIFRGKVKLGEFSY